MYYLQLRSLQKIGLIFLCSAMLTVFHTYAAAAPLYTDLTRLHVIAHSDSETDQALKLKVRDRVLSVTAPMTVQAENANEVRTILRRNLSVIEAAAQETLYANGSVCPVRVRLADRCWFDRREYENFTLPAGEYTALKVEIGAASGKNWWCVVFPPLCTTAAIKDLSPQEAGLNESQWKLITADGTEYAVRFWILDWIAKLCH